MHVRIRRAAPQRDARPVVQWAERPITFQAALPSAALSILVAIAAAAPDRPDTLLLYRSRGPDPLRRLFHLRFPAFQDAYEQRYAVAFGRFRLPLIVHAASAFRLCGDWSQGIAYR
jgi:hypothetical protein